MPERRLAAIMFTDIVGYTALMGADEDRAFEMLGKNREIHKKIIGQYNGTIIKEMGDGMLVTFNLASDAVHCSIEIQKACKEMDIPLKIGIHEGEIVFDGLDVLGDGVNIASRIQDYAKDGCIMISRSVYTDIKNKTNIKTEYLGEKRFKNVSESIKVYKILCEHEIAEEQYTPHAKKKSKKQLRIAYYIISILIIAVAILLIWNALSSNGDELTAPLLSPPTELSIAVLPFKNLSGNQDQEVMCDGLTEEIIHYLSSIKEFDKVISRPSVMTFKESEKTIPEIANLLKVNYILEGSYRQSGNRLRITANLIDAKSDNQIWTEIYERPVGDIFDIQSDIAKNIASHLKGELSLIENDQINKKPTDNLEAYNLYLKGRFFWNRRSEEDVKRSISYFSQALELDTTYALAYAGLADTYFILAWWGMSPVDDAYNKGKIFALKALSLDNDIAQAHATLGGIATWYEWNWKDAEKEIQLAISINPNYASAYQYYSELFDVLGENKKAREQINHALSLSPNSLVMNSLSGMYHYHCAEYKKAIEESRKALEISYYFHASLLILKSYIKLGMEKEAVEQLKNIVSRFQTDQNLELIDQIYQKSGIEGVLSWFIDWMLINKPNEHFSIASFYAINGDSEKAIEQLEKGFEIHEGRMPRMRNNPDFDILKTNPKFIALLRKMRL